VRGARSKGPTSLPRAVTLGFALIIAVGGLLLSLPLCSNGYRAPHPLDAIFTACSATCVTGLVPLDTATQYNWLGQAVVLLLIQVGGLGYMTAGTILAILLGRRLYLRRMVLLAAERGELEVGDAKAMARYIAGFTFTCEGIGAAILTLRFMADFPFRKALAFGVFHAVSAFCNAGFDILGRDTGEFASLSHYAGDPVVTAVVSLLIILGGVGFIVVAEVSRKRQWGPLSAHAKAVIAYTVGLIVLGTALFWAAEASNARTLGQMPLGRALGSAYFQSVTPRTAGFSMFVQEEMRAPSVVLACVLMFVGASPGGTGGGIKVSTLAVLLAMVRSFSRGSEEVTLFERRVPQSTVNRAAGLALLSASVVVVATTVLVTTEHLIYPLLSFAKAPLFLLFEVCSAFGTVGLSCGVTRYLSPVGKVVIMTTMFAGRVGVLTLLLAAAARRPERVHFPEGRIAIG
jgi:trk system potassium uptake protein TrkH